MAERYLRRDKLVKNKKSNIAKLSKTQKQEVICQRQLMLSLELGDLEAAKNRDAITWGSIVHICDFTCIIFLNIMCFPHLGIFV